MPLTSAEITSTTHAAFLPEIWADDTQDAIEFKEVLSKLVNTSFEDEMAIGRVLHIPHRSNLATQTKTEGISNTIVFNAITQTNQDITVSTYEYAACLLNAVVQAQSKYNDRAALAGKMGYALVRGMEVSLANLFQNFSQVVGTYGGDTDSSVLRRAWQYLADAGFYDDASWVFSPGAAQSIFGQDHFISKDFQSGARSAIETARLPMILGHPAFVSNLLRSPAAGQHDNALIHRSSVILVRQVKPTPKTQYRIEYNADAMLMFDLYAVAEAEQPAETPPTDSGGPQSSATETIGDYGAVLIRGQ
jgi:hypothetical protein